MSGAQPRLVVIGASGHAKVVLDAVERSASHRVVALLDDGKPAGSSFYGYPVRGGTPDLTAILAGEGADAFFVAIGDDTTRARIAEQVRASHPGLAWATIVHPSASLARGVSVGAGTVVMAGAVINADARVGEGCIVNTRASVDHDALVEDFAGIAPAAALGGNVHVGAHAFVGIGASVVHGARIGAHAVIGAGAAVTGDIPERAVAVGVPARVVRQRTPGERYL